MTGPANAAPTAPVIWPLVQIAGDHMVQSDARNREDEGGNVALSIMEALRPATPTNAREVGALLLVLRCRLDDLATAWRENAASDGAADRAARVDRIEQEAAHILARAAAVLWQGDGWNTATERVYSHFTAASERATVHADLCAAGLPGLPAGLLDTVTAGKGGAS